MASGDFNDLATQTARSARFDPSDTTDLARAKEAVNRVYLSCLAGGEEFDFLEQEGQWTTTAGSDVYTYASIGTAIGVSGASIAEITWLSNDSDGPVLDSMSWPDLEKLAYSTQDGDSGGQPVYWAKWASRIRLYPTPDQVYALGAFCRLAPAEMSADSDTPLIPLAFRHAVIVNGAAAILLRQEGGMEAHQEAQFYQRAYDEAWLRMRTAHATAHKPTFRLKSTGWDADFTSPVRDDPWSWTR